MSDPDDNTVLLTADTNLVGVSTYGMRGTIQPAQMVIEYQSDQIGTFSTRAITIAGDGAASYRR